MAKNKNNIAFDTNIWISFSLGKRLSRLKYVVLSRKFNIYYSKELIDEYVNVVRRKKFEKYISKERVNETIDLIDTFCEEIKLVSDVVHDVDVNDSFLLSLCIDADLDLLITGDPHLLKMKKYGKTNIVSFSQFIAAYIKR